MYCETCDADVAAEVSTDGKSLLCTTCGGEVRKSFAPSLSDEAKSARDLLERWSQDDGTDPFGPASDGSQPEKNEGSAPKKPSFRVDSGEAGSDQAQSPSNRRPAAQNPPIDPSKTRRTDAAASLSGPKIRPKRGSRPNPPRDYESSGDLLERPNRPRNERPSEAFSESFDAVDDDQTREPARTPQPISGSSKKKFRIDAAHTRSVELQGDGPTIPPPHRRPAPAMPDGHRLDAGHDISRPHMRTESFVPPGGKRPGRFESMAGQLLAYGGVGLLTVGTALILSGYFGGPVKYAPTGWLVATIGQMFLFLGVVTLISGGMQQTTHEVGARVADLGSRLGRIEETTELALHGPHFMKAKSGTPVHAAVRHDDHDGERWLENGDHLS